MITLRLLFHSKRSRFDRTGEAQKKACREYSHKDNMEDYWANCSDEFEIKKKFSRLPINLVWLYNFKAIPDQVEDDGDLIQDHAYEAVKDKSIGEIDWLEEEKIELEQLMTLIIKYTKLWLKHKMWELESEEVQCTYDLMDDLESHSTSEKLAKQDPKGKGKVSSPFKTKIKDIKAEEVQEAEKQRKTIAKKTGHASRTKKPTKDETEKEDKEVSLPVLKRRRIVRVSQKEKGISKVGEEVGPPVVNVES